MRMMMFLHCQILNWDDIFPFGLLSKSVNQFLITIFVMGDFNINLLSYDRHTDTYDFINSMVSPYLLPYILHPTRVTDHSTTVIDNIFSNMTDSDTERVNQLNRIDLPSQLATLPAYEILSRLDNLPQLNDFDLDDNLMHSIDSKYHKVSGLSNINTAKTFSLFHVNIRSLTKHFSELHLLINSTKIPFDIIGITESKQTWYGFCS